MKIFLLIMLWGGLINFCSSMEVQFDEDGKVVCYINIDDYENPFVENPYLDNVHDLDGEDIFDELNGSEDDDFFVGLNGCKNKISDNVNDPKTYTWSRLKPKKSVGYIAAEKFLGKINKKHSFKKLMLKKRIYFKSLNGEYLSFSECEFEFRMYIVCSFFLNYRIDEILFNSKYTKDIYEKDFLKRCAIFFKKFFLDTKSLDNKNTIIQLFEKYSEIIYSFLDVIHFIFNIDKSSLFISKGYFYCLFKKSLAAWTSTDLNALRCNKFEFSLNTITESLDLSQEIKELIVHVLKIIFLTTGHHIQDEFYSIDDNKIIYNSVVLI